MDDATVRTGLLVFGGLIVANKLSDLFGPDEPGGNTTPGKGDTRPATLSIPDATALADRIYTDLRGDQWLPRPWEYDEDAAVALMVPRVTADVRLVMNEYAKKDNIHTEVNLTSDVVNYLDTDYRAAVNSYYAQNGITIRF